jgi:hypothetical protein
MHGAEECLRRQMAERQQYVDSAHWVPCDDFREHVSQMNNNVSSQALRTLPMLWTDGTWPHQARSKRCCLCSAPVGLGSSEMDLTTIQPILENEAGHDPFPNKRAAQVPVVIRHLKEETVEERE